MPYTTTAQLVKRIDRRVLAGLASDELNGPVTTTAEADSILAAVAPAAVIANCIADSEVEINSYVGSVLDMSVQANIDAVENRASDFALYYAYRRRGYDGENNPFYEAYKQGISWLKSVQKGTLHVSSDPQRPDTNIRISTRGNDKKFSDDSLGGFAVT